MGKNEKGKGDGRERNDGRREKVVRNKERAFVRKTEGNERKRE